MELNQLQTYFKHTFVYKQRDKVIYLYRRDKVILHKRSSYLFKNTLKLERKK